MQSLCHLYSPGEPCHVRADLVVQPTQEEEHARRKELLLKVSVKERSTLSVAASVTAFSSLSRSRSQRAGSVDPLIEYSDGDSGGGNGVHRSSTGTLHRSVSRGELDTQSVARSYNETIIRPVTRPLHTPTGASYRSSRSHATSEVSIAHATTFFVGVALLFMIMTVVVSHCVCVSCSPRWN